jgi:hypothetical protein
MTRLQAAPVGMPTGDGTFKVLGRMETLEKLEFLETAGITDAGMAVIVGMCRQRARCTTM